MKNDGLPPALTYAASSSFFVLLQLWPADRTHGCCYTASRSLNHCQHLLDQSHPILRPQTSYPTISPTSITSIVPSLTHNPSRRCRSRLMWSRLCPLPCPLHLIPMCRLHKMGWKALSHPRLAVAATTARVPSRTRAKISRWQHQRHHRHRQCHRGIRFATSRLQWAPRKNGLVWKTIPWEGRSYLQTVWWATREDSKVVCTLFFL